MKLEEARSLTDHHPPAGERLTLLQQQREAFRRDFYMHVQMLERCRAWQEAGITVVGVGGATSPVAELIENSERDLDTLSHAIKATTEEIAALDHDAA